MSVFADAKHHFYIDAVTHGIGSVEELMQAYPLGCAVPTHILERWLRKFKQPPDLPQLPTQARLVNHFKLGADPEFVFQDPFSGERVDASALGLKTSCFAGADLNGRLAEIRPRAYRSALRVLASILDSLRFLALLNPVLGNLTWRAGAFQLQDGLGGHVHFGRKRNIRSIRTALRRAANASQAEEVAVLDRLLSALALMQCYPKKEMEQRIENTHGRGNYGRFGDVRLQTHGYEYRAFPSWLDDPWVAYLTLVLSKLCVHNPGLLPIRNHNSLKQMQQFENLLRFYKGVDDDAAIALMALNRIGWPKHYGGDFKARWGITYPPDARLKAQVIPSSITPTEEAVQQLFALFTKGEKLTAYVPKPTWTTELPAGYAPLLSAVETAHRIGMGELLSDIAFNRNVPVRIESTDGERLFYISPSLWHQMPSGWIQKVKRIIPNAMFTQSADRSSVIKIGSPWRTPETTALVRKALLCGVFPLWKFQDVKPSSLKDFLKSRHQVNDISKVLYTSVER